MAICGMDAILDITKTRARTANKNADQVANLSNTMTDLNTDRPSRVSREGRPRSLTRLEP